ncbi:MAG TPA: metallophosphoesterase family protein, partial [Solirubrobacterales bacterium]|nr:metallophosphoesterase family protein [Solirubrobacterales bacterium]
MKVAVISDIHANRHALDAVLADIDESGIEEIWFLGDAVGYGAFPGECVLTLKDRCSVFLLGNHDLAALREIDIGTFSPSAAISARWTREHMDEDAFEVLRGLDGTSAEREGIGLFHASPRDPIWEYVVDSDLAEDNLDFQEQRVALIGHSHIALYFTRVDEMSRVSSVLAPEGTELEMSAGKWLLNPGSAGQPRDGDPRSAWAELDTESFQARFHRVQYPVEEAAEAIRKAGLPS